MPEFLIRYGADNTMATFEGNTPKEAIDAFEKWREEQMEPSANDISLIVPVMSRLDDPIRHYMSVRDLLNTGRIYCMSDEGMYHLLSVVEFAAENAVLHELQRVLNYIAPTDDSTIVLSRDGRHEERSFFWNCVSREHHKEQLSKAGIDLQFCNFWSPIIKGYELPKNSYHGGMIWRERDRTWSVHT